MKRSAIPKAKSKRMFSKTADLVNKKNLPKALPMRGGIRL